LTDYGGSARLRVWDADTANGYDDFVNGTLVYSDTTLGAVDGGFSRGFLQA
jgi:hypothetical protein